MRFVLIKLIGDKQEERLEFSQLPVRIGRSSSNDLVLTGDNRRASSRHAEITADNRGVFYLRDLESTNGTFLNGMRISQAQINIGDLIEFGLGGPKLRFEIADAASPK